MPEGWVVIDGNNDNFMWKVVFDSIYQNHYACYSDYEAGNNVINYNEELWTPPISVFGINQLKIRYNYFFMTFEPGEKYRVHFRKKVGGYWTEWIVLKIYVCNAAGIDSFDLTNQLPCDSIQFRFFYSDSTSYSHWGYICGCDNVLVRGFVSVSEEDNKTHPAFFVKPFIVNNQFFVYLNLKNRTNLEISIYTLCGRKIIDIYKGIKEKGNYMLKYNINLNTGVYFIIFKTITPPSFYTRKIIEINN